MDFLVLGPVEIRDESRVVDVGGPRSTAIVAALLAHAGQTISQDRLAEALWPDSDRARDTLQTYVSRIRKSLGASGADILVRQGTGYLLSTGGNADSNRFESLLGEAQSALGDGDRDRAAMLVDDALGLWRGTAFNDHEHDELVSAEAHRLEERRLVASELQLEIALLRGEHREVVADIERLSTEHPLRERLWELRMEALVGAGRQAEALRAFQEARHALADELGIEPSTALKDLERRILEQDPSLQPQRPRAAGREPDHLPSNPTPLIGRSDELASIAEKLRDVRLLTLIGFGGVGKTRLAVEAARAASADYSAGVRMVDLSEEVDPEAASRMISGKALELESASGPGLLIVDNCEHLIDSCAQAVSAALARHGDLTILATSREPLRIPGEHRWSVDPLAIPDGETSQRGLSESASVRLFVDRASAVRSSKKFGQDELADIGQICRVVEGIPLAIELAAAGTATMSVHHVAEGLQARREVLTDAYRTSPTRHRSLENVLDWSYELLEDDERWLLHGLTTMLVSFPARAAEVVFASDDRSGTEVIEILRRLVDRSLVQMDESTGTTMYSLMMTTRAYAKDRAGWQAKFDTRGFIIGLAQQTPVELRGSPAEMWSALLDGPLEIAQKTLDLTYEQHDVEAGAFLVGLVAARTTQTGKVGFLGGVRWPYLEKFEEGFRAGVALADASVEVIVDYISAAPDFSGFATRHPDADRKTTALLERGVDVLFQCAGQFGGQNILMAAHAWKEATGRHVHIIGVDHDERITREPMLRPLIVTSMRRCIPTATYRALKAAVATGNEELPRLGLANGAIFLSRTGGEIEHLVEEIEQVSAAITEGTVELP